MTDKIERAKLLAQFVHMGQKRQDKEEYINHCSRVVESVNDMIGYKDEDLICAAWLHDCLEDCKDSYYLHAIMMGYFGVDVTKLVTTLTHITPNKGSYDEDAGRCLSYNEYIERVAQNSEALQIKFADMIDNTSYPIPDKQKAKYRSAVMHLIELGKTNKSILIPVILLERLNINVEKL